MFASNITINDNAAAAKTFKQVSMDATGSVRIDDSTTNLSPRKMVLRHSTSTPKGSSVVSDRHLLQFSTTKLDADAKPHTAVINLTASVPRNGAITQTDVDHLFAFLKNWIATGSNVTGMLLGEY